MTGAWPFIALAVALNMAVAAGLWIVRRELDSAVNDVAIRHDFDDLA